MTPVELLPRIPPVEAREQGIEVDPYIEFSNEGLGLDWHRVHA